MKQPKRDYQFHNPNSPEVFAEYLTAVFMEANAKKVEEAIQAAADTAPSLEDIKETPQRRN